MPTEPQRQIPHLGKFEWERGFTKDRPQTDRTGDALHRTWVTVGERLATFNGKLRDELLDTEIFYTLLEVRVLTERYRRTYNQVRPHSSLGYRPPAPEALLPADFREMVNHAKVKLVLAMAEEVLHCAV